jgi:hypothetical protein
MTRCRPSPKDKEASLGGKGYVEVINLFHGKNPGCREVALKKNHTSDEQSVPMRKRKNHS